MINKGQTVETEIAINTKSEFNSDNMKAQGGCPGLVHFPHPVLELHAELHAHIVQFFAFRATGVALI